MESQKRINLLLQQGQSGLIQHLKLHATIAGQMIERDIGMTRYLKKTEDALKIATDPAAVFPKYAEAVEKMRATVGTQVKEDVENFIKLGYSVDKAEEMARLGVEHFYNYKLSQINAEFPGVGVKTSC